AHSGCVGNSLPAALVCCKKPRFSSRGECCPTGQDRHEKEYVSPREPGAPDPVFENAEAPHTCRFSKFLDSPVLRKARGLERIDRSNRCSPPDKICALRLSSIPKNPLR